jgi:uncharacterized membrane protein YccC
MMMLAVFISMLMQIPQVGWTVIVILILSLPEVGTTWRKALMRVFGTFLGAASAVAMISMFSQSPLMLIGTFGAVLFVGLYLSMTMTASSYLYFMVVVTVILVAQAAWHQPIEAAQFAIERFQNTVLGIICVTLGVTLMWPVRAEDQLIDSMIGRIKDARRMYGCFIDLLDGRPDPDMPQLTDHYSPLAEQLALLQGAEAESHVVERHRDTILALLTVVDRLASMGTEIQEHWKQGLFNQIDDDCRDSMRRTLLAMDAVLDAVVETRTLRIAHLNDEMIDRVNREAEHLAEIRSRMTDPDSLSLTSTVIQIGEQVRSMHTLDSWSSGSLVENPVPDQSPLADARLHRSLLDPFLHIDRLSMRTAIKACIATTVALLVVAALQWSTIGATAMVTCVLVVLPTIGASAAKSLQRIIGALAGFVAGVVSMAYLTPNTQDIAALLTVVFAVGFISQWVMLGRWDLAYAGMQFGFAYAITALAVSYPSTDLGSGIDRVFGILVGIAVSFLVLWLIWPVRASSQLLHSFSQAARTLASLIEFGLGQEQQKPENRPLFGYRYHLAWLLADAFRYRQEARFDKKLLPSSGVPALKLGSSFQSLTFRVYSLILNRVEHERVQEYGRLQPVHDLRHAIVQYLEAIADHLETGVPIPASAVRQTKIQALASLANLHDLSETDRSLVATQVGYYTEIVEQLPRVLEDAQETRRLYG